MVWLQYLYVTVCQGPGCLHTTSHTTDQHKSRWSSTKTYCNIHILKSDIFWNSGLNRERFCETFLENRLWTLGRVLYLNLAMSWLCLPYQNDQLCQFNFVSGGTIKKAKSWYPVQLTRPFYGWDVCLQRPPLLL